MCSCELRENSSFEHLVVFLDYFVLWGSWELVAKGKNEDLIYVIPWVLVNGFMPKNWILMSWKKEEDNFGCLK